jgi:dephospho-CoA kinase
MKLFGLTGGIGMGKSTSASLLVKRGVPVIDTDVIAREVVEPGQPALNEIAAKFGPDLIDVDGKLRRAALGEIVFASNERRAALEAILHPRIRERWLQQIESWRAAGEGVGVVVIPLLFETDATSNFDAVICTACSSATQRERLLARGLTPEQIGQRVAAQWPIDKKIAASNHVVWTEGTMEMHERQIEKLFGDYLSPRR